MSHISLTAKYRPQRFADVAGQETVRTVLSRAAAEDKIAPAYLFSGTRGVGKTTVARILAKAINCREAPGPEPCNQCPNCRQITGGSGVDVIEIDGASNRGIDDARRMREDIGFAPMEFRYKVFIIDEAHMLTREAFNALLKTLEEPPGHVTFILATTEPHKFPATIISRCQHYIFQRLPEPGIAAHLTNILTQENAEFEEGAVRLIAKRAAGSVRDSMSLLGQVMALGAGAVREQDVRSILGLAGREVFEELFTAIAGQDVLGVNELLRRILDQGLDLGFFLRELSQMWRNLFLLSQAGEQGRAILEMPDEEAEAWLAWSKTFPLNQIHASWQMTLEGQRKVLTSLEPALALELLLLNLALLPRLLSLDELSARGAPQAGQGGGPSGGQGGGQGGPATGRGGPGPGVASGPGPSTAPTRQSAPNGGAPGAGPTPPEYFTPPKARVMRANAGEPGPALRSPAPQGPDTPPPPQPDGPRTWDGFLDYCRRMAKVEGHNGVVHDLGRASGAIEGDTVRITCTNGFMCEKVSDRVELRWLTGMAKVYFGEAAEVSVEQGANSNGTYQERKAQVEQHPVVQRLKSEMGANLVNGTINMAGNGNGS